jgi:succinate dehydrogenase/fumarate reductase flavoprotein subunit
MKHITWIFALLLMSDAVYFGARAGAEEARKIIDPAPIAQPSPDAANLERTRAALTIVNEEKSAAENRAMQGVMDVDRLNAEVDSLNGKLNQEIAKSQALQKQVDEFQKAKDAK